MKEVIAGTIIDHRFEVLNEIGQGGMGVVYRARQMNVERSVALKLLKVGLAGDPDKVTRFQREARIISILEHKNIVQIYAIGLLEEAQPYIAMEYLTGSQLSEIIRDKGPIPWRCAIEYTLQICDALEYAHEHNIIHRDIKPSNIIVCDDDTAGGGTLKLVDFGIAKSLVEAGPALTQTEMVIGSVFYLSPGQLQGRAADPSSDIYSLGCTLFEMLVGHPPFVGDTIYDTVAKQATEALPKVNQVNRKANIPEPLQHLLERMTAKNSQDRIGSSAQVKTYLQKIMQGVETDLAPPRSQPKQFRIGVVPMIVLAAIVCTFVAVNASLLRPVENRVRVGPFLTADDEERKLADLINRQSHFGADDTVRLPQAYRDLSTFYEGKGMPLAAYLCSLESSGCKASTPLDKYRAAWMSAQNLRRLGRCAESLRAVSRLLEDSRFRDGDRLYALETALVSGYQSANYEAAIARMEDLDQRLETYEADWVLPLLIQAADSELALHNVKEAQKKLEALSARLGTRSATDPVRVRYQLLKMEFDKLSRNKVDDGAYEQLVRDFNRSPSLVSLLGLNLARAAALYGHSSQAISLVEGVTAGLLAESGSKVDCLEHLSCALRDIDRTRTLLSPGQRARVENDRERLRVKFESLKDQVNHPTPPLLLPVPVDHAKAQEREVLNL